MQRHCTRMCTLVAVNSDLSDTAGKVCFIAIIVVDDLRHVYSDVPERLRRSRESRNESWGGVLALVCEKAQGLAVCTAGYVEFVLRL